MENLELPKNNEVRFYVRYNRYQEPIPMETIAITNLRKKLYETIQEVIDYNQPLTILTKKGNAVVLSESDYRSLQETIALLSEPGYLDSIKAAEKEDPKEMTVYHKGEKW